jgi:DNA-binding transcriptional MerR regulator
MPGTEPTWSIAQLADEFRITHRTIRFYEDQGLISPQRRGSQRIFHPRDRVRLALVLRGKRLGFDLAQIRRIVDMYDQPPGEAGQLHYLLEQIAARRADLEQRRKDIEETLDELAEVERRCLADLTQLGDPVPLDGSLPPDSHDVGNATGAGRWDLPR